MWVGSTNAAWDCVAINAAAKITSKPVERKNALYTRPRTSLPALLGVSHGEPETYAEGR